MGNAINKKANRLMRDEEARQSDILRINRQIYIYREREINGVLGVRKKILDKNEEGGGEGKEEDK